ncbi:hypothetical protein TrispH2_001544 [Trichoplax sp. H2]|nr:hypothetical protein TrispH2_001544 [Trichoplax sp. H2]|eukprot:RDD47050.1 hypothetical protein TrispH2_001544 [Trichoplax sp. H2]
MSIPHKQLLNEDELDTSKQPPLREGPVIQAEAQIPDPNQSQEQIVTTVIDDPNRNGEGIPEFPIRKSIVVGWQYCRKIEGILKILELMFSFLSFCLTASWRSKYQHMPHYTIRPNDVGFFIFTGVITWLYCTADCAIHIIAAYKNLAIASSSHWLTFNSIISAVMVIFWLVGSSLIANITVTVPGSWDDWQGILETASAFGFLTMLLFLVDSILYGKQYYKEKMLNKPTPSQYPKTPV